MTCEPTFAPTIASANPFTTWPGLNVTGAPVSEAQLESKTSPDSHTTPV